ncbi:MAG: rRNA maturation RNase YbeY [Pirellula sp.]
MSIRALFHQSQRVRSCNTNRMKKAIQRIALDYGWKQGEISVALVSDDEIHVINREHLSHDYATDVISFDLTDGNEVLDGEIIASVETADRDALEHGWSGEDELLLYVIHGMLHIIGLRDKKASETKIMRSEETHYLRWLRVEG